jgi:hypothetical protein
MDKYLLRWGLVLLCVLAPTAAPAQTSKKARAATDPFDLAAYDARIQPAEREHWAFQPLQRSAPPAVRDANWCNNPIDAFILAGLEAQGLQPAPPAEPRALLRRLHLGLTGLPPTPEEVEDFERVMRTNPQAGIAGIVERLLASPRYGERWARHWLDLVRYADTNGYERDAARPHVWRYRDYVIRAFNEDRPFDRFILEQLAGDELPDATGDTLIATGYYRLGPWDDEPADPKEDRFDQLDDLVNTTSQAFLGLTLACARCHDHKFEPLTMLDYYRMVAVFQPLQRPTQGRRELDLPAGSPQQIAHLAARDRSLALLRTTALSLRGAAPSTPAPALLDAISGALRHTIPDLPRGYFLHEPSPQAPVTHLLLRGKAARPGPRVEPGVPAVMVTTQPAFLPPSATSRRRLTLARWIASRDNPLTARVIVNRVWHYHFGQGLVRTPSDFGVMGQPPTHPELLDWLADSFMREGWSLKKLHRLIVTSATYQQSSRGKTPAADPDNRLLWRFPYRRLEAEAIRDAMLAVSGRLNPRMYGPSMYPFIPPEALAGNSDPDKIWPAFDEPDASRRTLYAFQKRSMVVPLLEVLDLCDSTRSCDKRLVTTVAPQALSLFNGDFVQRQARHFAERLQREAGAEPAAQLERAYLLALCRPPAAPERTLMLDFLSQEADNLRRAGVPDDTARRQALEQLCRVLFNLNEFVYPD